ncbi:basic secretory protein-like protein [Roseateles albus]|uniref:Basic secretory protein-like protein n=1 Tax=Roseateles albus TaxID=2987525 RepID=A0ABT5KG97_9BURK|nr:basic secretory protein-like protein [Roseateles albus]MDC8772963.1 basic secretory protein-like protein [Roseateles albus]
MDRPINKRRSAGIRRLHYWLVGLTNALLLSACGGGEDAPPRPAPVPVVDMSPRLARPACGNNSPLTLFVINTARVDPVQLEKLVCTFYETYPAMSATLKTDAPKEVTYSFDDAPNQPPAWVAGGATVYYSTRYLAQVPKDVDVAVHELTHVIQGKLTGAMPGWIIEGTADWMRNLFGRYNQEIGWALSDSVAPTARYIDGYGTAAQFFNWVDKTHRQGRDPVAVALHLNALQGVNYNSSVWVTLTGKTLAELWSAYSGQPYMPAPSVGVSFYTEQNYQGPEVKLGKGRYDLKDLLWADISNDAIRSIRVPAGFKLTVYQHENFTGLSLTLQADTDTLLPAFDRAISSLLIE